MSLISNRTFFKNFTSVSIKDATKSGHGGSEILLISINATGTRLVNSRTDRSIRIWKCTPEKLIDPVVIERPHARTVESVAWNPNTDHTFASVGKDDIVKIWKCTGTLEKEIRVHSNESQEHTVCHIVRYSLDGEVLSVVDKRAVIHFYSVKTNYCKIGETSPQDHVYDLQWFNHKHSFFSCSLHDGTIPIFSVEDSFLKEGQITSLLTVLKTRLSGHRSYISCLAIDPRGNYLAAGSNEGIVSIWNTSSMLNSAVLTDTDEAVSGLSISRDGTYIAVAYDTGSNIKIYDHASTDQVFEVPNSRGGKLCASTICWFPSKTAFIYSSDNARTMIMMKKPEK